MNYMAEKLINDLVVILKCYNKDAAYEEKNKVDIPFLIAPLTQVIEKEEYSDFLKDLEKYPAYDMEFEEKHDGYYDNDCLHIHLNEVINDIYSEVGFGYDIIFGYDPRDWGYCECSPEDENYREDKKCCGHGCDWWAPTVQINKVTMIGYHAWDKDEHDFWDFEDKFYNSDAKSKEEKEKKEKELKIKQLKEQIANAQKELDKLN